MHKIEWNNDFIVANAVLLLAWILFFIGWDFGNDKVWFLTFALLLILPFWCLCYSREEQKYISLHFLMLILMSMLAVAILGQLLSIGSGIVDTIISVFIFYTIWVVVAYIIRKKKFFEAFWFGANAANFILIIEIL